MNAPREQTGSGGGLRYRTEAASSDMLNQEQSHSCQAACARQLLRDAGVAISEAALLDKIGYYEGIGTIPKSAARVLTELHPALNFDGGEIREDALPILCSRDPWIANLRTNRGKIHSVIVDRLADGVVYGSVSRCKRAWRGREN